MGEQVLTFRGWPNKGWQVLHGGTLALVLMALFQGRGIPVLTLTVLATIIDLTAPGTIEVRRFLANCTYAFLRHA